MRYWLLLFISGVMLNLSAQDSLVSYRKSVGLMGSHFELTAISDNDSLNRTAIRAAIKEMQRIEELISSWDSHSQTSEINRQAGKKAVKVDPELYQLIFRSLKISQLSQGAFDLSFASADRIWRFDGTMQNLPADSAIAASVAKINYQNIVLNPDSGTVFLQEEGMKIGFGAIGKGYAANQGRKIMQSMGIRSGLVNAGGDLICWGTPIKRDSWRIGIADPGSRNKVLAWLGVTEMAVVTSGDYERYVMIDGQRYSHIIDPKSGWPVKGLKSVTVLCPDAELADALATTVFVLGPKKGLQLLNQLKNIEAVLLTDQDELLTTKGLELQTVLGNETGPFELKVGGMP